LVPFGARGEPRDEFLKSHRERIVGRRLTIRPTPSVSIRYTTQSGRSMDPLNTFRSTLRLAEDSPLWMPASSGRLRAVGDSEVLADRYRLRERLRVAGPWQVWRADDELLRRAVSLSVCDAAHRLDVVTGLMPHPHLAQVFDSGEAVWADGSRLRYVVTERPTGLRLDQRIAHGRLAWPTAARIGSEIAAALAALHSQGVAFGDLQPADVILTASGAKAIWLGVHSPLADASPASDVYALGRLMYEMLLGSPPVPGTVPTLAVEGLPTEMARLCDRCLDPNPHQRPTSDEAAVVLADAVSYEDDPAAASPGRPPAPQPVWDSETGALVRPAYHPDSRGTGEIAIPTVGADGERPHRRTRVAMVAAALTLAAVVAASIAWLGLSRGDVTSAATAAPLEAATARQPDTGCLVRYRVRDETHGTFTVDITVTDTGTGTWPSWTLSFRFAGDQHLVRGQAATWQQIDTDVTAQSSDAMAPRGSTTIGFTGTYTTTDPWPTEFTVNGTSCAYTIVDSAGHVRSSGTPSTPAGSGTTPATPPATLTTGPTPSPDPDGSTGTPRPSDRSSTSHDGGHGKPSGKPSHH
jgi:serine/threonine-protein kinase